MADNIITAVFGATRETKVRPRYRYDQGQVLIVRGVKNLPDFYEVHFANEGSTADATPLIGTTDGVTIPDSYFQSGATIYAYIYVHDEATDGTTVYKVTIPIINRARPANVEPTPEQEDIISQAIVALNENVGKAEAAAEQAEESVAVAQSAADGAAQAERHAGAHATRAIGASQAAQASEMNASSSATTAQEAAQSAADSESQADAILGVCTNLANRTTNNAMRAESAENSAKVYANQAQTSANTANTAKGDALTAKTDAQTAANNAANSQSAAETAADEAETAAARAETAADEAEDAESAAVIAKTDAQTYAEQAGQSASSAAQTLVQVQSEGATQIAAIDAEAATQIVAIDAEGQRVLESIPSDYTQMEEDVTNLKSQMAQVGDAIRSDNLVKIDTPYDYDNTVFSYSGGVWTQAVPNSAQKTIKFRFNAKANKTYGLYLQFIANEKMNVNIKNADNNTNLVSTQTGAKTAYTEYTTTVTPTVDCVCELRLRSYTSTGTCIFKELTIAEGTVTQYIPYYVQSNDIIKETKATINQLGKYAVIMGQFVQAGYVDNTDSWVYGYATRVGITKTQYAATDLYFHIGSGYEIVVYYRNAQDEYVSKTEWQTGTYKIDASSYYQCIVRKTNASANISVEEVRNNIYISSSSVAEEQYPIDKSIEEITISKAAKDALLKLLQHVAFVDANGQQYYNDLMNTL